MSNQLNTNDAVSTESLTEYELMMQLSDELAQKTDEVAALMTENAELQERFEKVSRELAETQEEKEILIKVLAFESELADDKDDEPVAEPITEPVTDPDAEQAEPYPARNKASKVMLITAVAVAIIVIGIIASVVTFSVLYDMELTTAAATLTEGIMTLVTSSAS